MGCSNMGGQSATIVQTRPNGSIDSTHETLPTEGWRELIVPAADYEASGMDGIRSLPYYLQWESSLLVRQLVAGVDSLNLQSRL